MPLIRREGSVRPHESARPKRRPLATSAPPSTAATSFGMSSGEFCKSASIVTTTSPRARTSPACMAGCWPKFRLNRTARTCPSPACRRSSTAQVPSEEPSSTKMSSYGCPSDSRAATLRRYTSSSVPSSLKTGTTSERAGWAGSSSSGSAWEAVSSSLTVEGGYHRAAPMHAELVERVERVAKDDLHGASWLAKEAVEAVALAIELGEDPVEL